MDVILYVYTATQVLVDKILYIKRSVSKLVSFIAVAGAVDTGNTLYLEYIREFSKKVLNGSYRVFSATGETDL
jgi:hypothetical protein